MPNSGITGRKKIKRLQVLVSLANSGVPGYYRTHHWSIGDNIFQYSHLGSGLENLWIVWFGYVRAIGELTGWYTGLSAGGPWVMSLRIGIHMFV